MRLDPELGRVIKKSDSNGTELNYSYDLDGNQASKTENRVKTEYIYDGLGQLVIEKEASAGAKQYSYDQSGNRVKMDVIGTEKYTTVYSYDDNNRLTKAETKRVGQDTILTAYSYDTKRQPNSPNDHPSARDHRQQGSRTTRQHVHRRPYRPTAGVYRIAPL